MNDPGLLRRHVIRERQHFVRFERVHAGDADDRRARVAQKTIDRSAVSEISNRRSVPSHLERRGDVLEAERLDFEERTETKTIVPGHWTQQEDVHTRTREAIIQLSSGSKRGVWSVWDAHRWNRF